VFGKFNGEVLIADDGKRYDVPANYSSKSVLVFGDKLKTYEENGERKFKQVERVKRFRVEGMLAKKEGKWHVVTSDSSYRVNDAAVEHFGVGEGEMVVVLLPLDNKFAPFAAIESAVGKTKTADNQAKPQSKSVALLESVPHSGDDKVTGSAENVSAPVEILVKQQIDESGIQQAVGVRESSDGGQPAVKNEAAKNEEKKAVQTVQAVQTAQAARTVKAVRLNDSSSVSAPKKKKKNRNRGSGAFVSQRNVEVPANPINPVKKIIAPAPTVGDDGQVKESDSLRVLTDEDLR
ncbi:hypothetical protein HY419_00920, partial [candidate division WWE3 bacterium]|nr:hypothetical protein [candidate division WWE3 bacterium]